MNLDFHITKNFTLRELCRSHVATTMGITNIPTEEEADNLNFLAINVLQPLRNYLKIPLIINSGYRNAKVNKLVGGSANSYHLSGQAVDIAMPSWEVAFKAIAFLTRYKLAEIILSKKGKSLWVHVAFDAHSEKRVVTFKQY